MPASVRRRLAGALPLRAYLELAALRGRLHARRAAAPALLENLRSCRLGEGLGEEELARLARANIAFGYLRRASRTLPAHRSFPDPARWPVRGGASLDDALAGGRGALLVSAHFGYSPLAPAILRLHGYDVVNVVAVRRMRRPERRDERDIEATVNVRPIFTALAENRPVFLLGDGMRALDFAPAEILGRTLPVATGFVKIALATGAPVLPVFAVDGERPTDVVVEIGTPLPLDPAAPAAANVQRFGDVFEAELVKRPHLWDRWSTRDVFETAAALTGRDVADRHAAGWRRDPVRSRG